MQPAEGLNIDGFVTQANGIYGTGDCAWATNVAVTSASTVVVDAAQASATEANTILMLTQLLVRLKLTVLLKLTL